MVPSCLESSSSPPLSSSSSPSPSSSTAPFPFAELTVTFPIVGRKHYAHFASSSQFPSSSSLPPCLLLLREAHNPRDPLALKAFHAFLPTPALLPLGHAPARLSSALSPLVDLHCLTFGPASLTRPDREDSDDIDDEWLASLPLVVTNEWRGSFASSALSERVSRHVLDLLAYVEWSGVDRAHRFIDNFRLVASSVVDRFGHLLTSDERALVDAFLALSPASQHLYCRLMQRKQTPSPLMAEVLCALPLASSSSSSPSSSAAPHVPASITSRWFLVNSLQYKHVHDMDAALDELVHPPVVAVDVHHEAHLPPELSSPCKLRIIEAAVTFANTVSSSPAKLYPPGPEEPSPPSSPLKQPPLTGCRLMMTTEELRERERGGGEDDVAGFVESSLSSCLSPSAFYSSVFDSLTAPMLKEFCAKLDIQLRASLSVAATKSALLHVMQRQRTMSGRCLLDDPRIRRTLHATFGRFVRLSPRFLLLCQRLYRLFFLSEDVSHSSIASASSPMMLEDLGRARWAKPLPRPAVSPSSSPSAALFPDRECFLAWDMSLQLLDVMSYAVDDFDVEVRAGFVHTPLALACMEEAYLRVQTECQHPNTSHHSPFTLIDRVRRMQASVNATATPHLFPTDYSAFFDHFQPYVHSSPSAPPSAVGRSYIRRFRASSTYAEIWHAGIAILEREHRYAEATSLLFRLLTLPFLPQRRGHWWNRLSLNLATHLSCKRQAMEVCSRAMEDDSVRTGDRVELQRRWHRLWRDKEGGNGLGIAPHVDRFEVPLPSTAKRRASATKAAAKDKKRRHSTNATVPIKQEEQFDEEDEFFMVPSVSRASSSPSSYPSAAPASLITQVTIQGRPTNREVGIKSHFYSLSNEQCTVEELALAHYEEVGFRGVHCENAFFGALFGLLMWDVVWDGDVEGVWLCPYQSGPMDMGEDEWYERRKGRVEARLAEVRAMDDVAEEVGRQWWKHHGERCRGVQWRAWSVERLQEMVRCMTSEAVAGVLGVMARDYHHWGGGLPDLFLWRPPEDEIARRTEHRDVVVISSSDDDDDDCIIEKGVSRRPSPQSNPCTAQRRLKKDASKGRCSDRVRLVEVKGPRDRLSPQQLAWLHVLAPFVPVEVCYVREDYEHI